ncbi:MAG: hypothetical protein GTO13_04300, partial [Proteobacteria bacterium]|nr:hypothetical protein [Pseudomonadota bacterium]
NQVDIGRSDYGYYYYRYQYYYGKDGRKRKKLPYASKRASNRDPNSKEPGTKGPNSQQT